MKPDLETAKVLTEIEELHLGVKGNFWAIIKNKLVDRITALNDIMNIDITRNDLAQQVLINQIVVRNLIEIIREIEGGAKSLEQYEKTFKDEKKEEYIKIMGES